MPKIDEKNRMVKLTESGAFWDKMTLAEEGGIRQISTVTEVKKDCFFSQACYNEIEPNTQNDGCR